MPAVLRTVFFLSGCAALLFETLWFRQAGLMLGNSVWSSSIVLASFMAGLGIGNLAAARLGDRMRRPIRVYAGLEVLIGCSGLLLVLLFPILTRFVAPIISYAGATAPVLHTTRLTVAFLLLLLPASAMGATLPVLIAAIGGGASHFGPSLGRLYGWNTLGAVAGALLGEFLFIGHLGVTGCGAMAAMLNLIAALIALRLPPGDLAPQAAAVGSALPGWRMLAAAFLAGGILLALEVIWFRFLLLFTVGTTATFAIMLASVLVGIAMGGLVGAAWLKRQANADRALPIVALIAGVSVVGAYWAFAYLPGFAFFHGSGSPATAGRLALALVLSTCLLSGLLFTLLGQALRRRIEGETRTAGLLTWANTLGGMSGAFIGGLLLLPGLGIERSLFTLGAAYGAVAALCFWDARPSLSRAHRLGVGVAAGLFALTLARFPVGLMATRFLPRIWQPYGPILLAEREGLTETSMYVTAERWARPVYNVLITNGHSMSATNPRAMRYMRMFSYLPVALQPEARDALVISFGLGSTVDALTEVPGLQSIHVVDISRDILEQGRVVYPPPRRYPLDDPRVTVHIEDGRFFLLTTRQEFDIITAEPPPPKNAGIVNLYSKEYFRLMHARLREGGIASYWLPVRQLTLSDTRAIARAFCDVFEDCTLWTGFGLEWIMVGTRNGRMPAEDRFTAPWREPRSRQSLTDIGLIVPEQLGTTFLCDADQLKSFLKDVPPLEDDFPQRLSPFAAEPTSPVYEQMLDPGMRQQRFATSAWVLKMWPAALRERTLARFAPEAPLLRYLATFGRGGPARWVPELAAAAGDPASRTVMLWMLQTTPSIGRAAEEAYGRGMRDPQLDLDRGRVAFVDGDYLKAEPLFERAQTDTRQEYLTQWQVLALALGGERERAGRMVQDAARSSPLTDRGWAFLISQYNLPDPGGLAGAAPR